MSDIRTVCRKDMCAGCMACLEKCPKDAIKIEDSLMSYNAVIDVDKCIDCDACHSVCQANNPASLKKAEYWWQGWATEDTVRNNSSSGGIAAAIERAFIKDGGVVCSCQFDKGEFTFDFAETEDDVKKFTGSKYVKSNPEGIYKKIQRKLNNGTAVLFVGLPCQVSAVRNFVGSRLEENLYTADLICHGSPSAQILDYFLKQHDIDLYNLESIAFRTKTKFQVKQNMQYIGTPGTLDKYSIAFLNCVNYTENCYSCKYARQERVSDITLGDNWGSELSDAEKKKGVSLILCQTQKGKELLERSNIHFESVDIDQALAWNHQLTKPSEKPSGREKFFDVINKGGNFDGIIRKLYPKNCFKQLIKAVLIKLKLYGGGT